VRTILEPETALTRRGGRGDGNGREKARGAAERITRDVSVYRILTWPFCPRHRRDGAGRGGRKAAAAPSSTPSG
jgi:hypothetical protein